MQEHWFSWYFLLLPCRGTEGDEAATASATTAANDTRLKQPSRLRQPSTDSSFTTNHRSWDDCFNWDSHFSWSCQHHLNRWQWLKQSFVFMTLQLVGTRINLVVGIRYNTTKCLYPQRFQTIIGFTFDGNIQRDGYAGRIFVRKHFSVIKGITQLWPVDALHRWC